MKYLSCLAWVWIALLLVGGITCVWQSAYTEAQAAETITIDAAVDEAMEVEGRRRPFSFRERRKMGATFSNIRRIMDDLSAKGELDSDSSIAMLQVVAVLKTENPKGWQAAEDVPPAEIDWDKLFEFIERLIALIMAMFS